MREIRLNGNRRLRIAVACIVAVSLLTVTPPAGADGVTGTTGAIEQVAMPPSLDSGNFVSESYIRLIDEGAGPVTAAMPDFEWDSAYHTGPYPGGTTFTTPAAGPGLPAVGTEVYSFLLHYDADVGGLPFSLTTGAMQSGTITFDRDILGVYVGSAGLFASDDVFSPGTTFPPDDRRDMEFEYTGDVFSIDPGRRQLSVTMFNHDGGYLDEMRIILAGDPVEDTTPPVITLVGPDPQTVEAGGSYVELGATASDNVDGNITDDVVIDATDVDPSTLGSYEVTYNVADGAGNDAVEKVRTVNVVDTVAPAITLLGPNPQTVPLGISYVEPGATALDTFEGDLSGNIVIDASDVDTATPGSYQVTYNVSDSSGNDAVQKIRTVNVPVAEDTTPPVLSLVGTNPQIVEVGSPYVELGAGASDDVEGDISSQVVIDASAVDTATLGSYQVTYNVSDSSGNHAMGVTRTVLVVDTTAPVLSLHGATPQRIGKGRPYVELGATAIDDYDGDVSAGIVIDASAVDTAAAGSYVVSYQVVDASGNVATAVRQVDVIDFFTDDSLSVHESAINLIALLGITDGCNPPANDRFCPGAQITRGQFAKFLAGVLGLTVREVGAFHDDDGNIFEPYIEMLAAAHITKGCNPPANDEFCPSAPITRGQVAQMLVNAFGFSDDGGGGHFIDTVGNIFEPAIGELATAGVTRGCNPPANDRFCPNANVSRAEFATFIVRAAGLESP